MTTLRLNSLFKTAVKVLLHTPVPFDAFDMPGRGQEMYLSLRRLPEGRYGYLYAKLLQSAGYKITMDLSTGLSLRRYGLSALTVPGLSIKAWPISGKADCVHVTDASDEVGKCPWKNEISIDYNWFSARPGDVVAPYPMHPNVYVQGWDTRLDELRDTPRRVGMLFSGNTDPNAYSTGPVRDLFGLLTRSEIIRAVLDGISEDQLFIAPPPVPTVEGKNRLLSTLGAETLEQKVVLPRDWRIPGDEWMPSLSTSAFFLAPPGVEMPLSHNIVEALACGVVPITNYGHLLKPALTNAEALQFSTAAELLARIDEALTMTADRRAAMSRAAAAYYDNHLSPRGFGEHLEASLSEQSRHRLFVNVEHYTVDAFRESSRAEPRTHSLPLL